MTMHEAYLQEALRLAEANVDAGGQPFGAVLVKDGLLIATGVNGIDASHDPTSHSEIEAIRAASRRLGTPDLSGSQMYASGFPCAMCLAAMYQAGVEAVYYAYGEEDGAAYGLPTAPLYQVLGQPFAKQPMPLVPVALPLPEPHLYRRWQETCHG
ncbi:nucleoside deaminase [Crenobacter cavernae]|uniref:Nucleoside deaminase n=1 Tax=Crenobacter cavernae TaxID=2290923 RepID=A0A345Y4X6_9NEIS|nr:nucleoside deaminase [Crenobacter cavernae]AXK38978.1 nucleoside deaminase [Crenobacter cavernae]